jgi:ABC-type Fe3+ transport system permease subunit
LKEQQTNYALAADARLICSILILMSIGVMDACHGRINSMMKGKTEMAKKKEKTRSGWKDMSEGWQVAIVFLCVLLAFFIYAGVYGTGYSHGDSQCDNTELSIRC